MNIRALRRQKEKRPNKKKEEKKAVSANDVLKKGGSCPADREGKKNVPSVNVQCITAAVVSQICLSRFGYLQRVDESDCVNGVYS